MSKYNVDNLCYKDFDHKKRLLELLLKDNTNIDDLERMSLFYIASSNIDLFNKFTNYLYNFKDHWIVPGGLNEVDLSSSQIKLIYLGFNLYNNYYDENDRMTILDTFSGLDRDYFQKKIK